MPYQQHVWDVALEVEADGRFAYDEIDLTIMRQSGKTTLEFAKSTWRLTVAPQLLKPDGSRWGRQRAIYTAQRRGDARKKLEQEFAELLRDSRSFREIKNPKARPAKPSEWKLSLNNGAENIMFGRGNYFQIDAPSQDAGHGDSLDDGNIDEAFALWDDAVEQGIGPTMATRWNPQLWVLSTAGNEKSPYLWGKVRAGRENSCKCAVRVVDDCRCGFRRSRTAYFEWSLPDDCDIDDEDIWWEYMPALGRTITPEFVRSRLEAARRNPDEGEDLWRRGYGNMWVRYPLLGGVLRPVKIPAAEWQDTEISDDEVPLMHPRHVPIGFDVSPGGAWSTIGIAGGSLADPYVEVTDHQQSTGWLPGRLVELTRRWRPRQVGYEQGGPAAAVADQVREAFAAAGLNPEIVKPLTAGEYRAACEAFYNDVVEGRLKRPVNPGGPLDVAVADATEKVVSGGFVYDRRGSTVPISPLISVVVARALLPKSRSRRPLVATT